MNRFFQFTCERSPLVGGCGGSSRAAGTYVVPGMHFEHCLLSAGRCREPRHRRAKQSSCIISAHRDWCGAGIDLCKYTERLVNWNSMYIKEDF